MVEPLRDFNGFSWNIISKDIENLNYNLMYQNMIFLVGNQFIDKWVNNYEPLIDYFELFQNNIEKKYGKKLKENIIENLIKLSIIVNITLDKNFKKELLTKKEKLEKEYLEYQDREIFLVKISKDKKKKEKQIKQLDMIISDKNLLIKEYEERNKNLPLNKKIFSIRVLKNNLKDERQNLVEKISEYNSLINPKTFLERKNLLEKKLKYIDICEIENEQKEIKKILIKLQKEIIKCMYIDIKNAEDKNTLIDIIYKYRYYNFLPINTKKSVFESEELKKDLDKLARVLIQKATDIKIICKISDNTDVNYNIIKNLILSKIISLEDIYVKPINEKDNLYIKVFDEEIEDNKIKLENTKKEDIKIKFNKKTKLFI